ncbi:MAG: sporulation protein YqfD [Bacillota bacterium]|nr:sporulation protein YqfD [Bacillota bacterium]
MNFSKYNNGVVTIEIQSMLPEKFLNLLWKSDIKARNISRVDITTMTMEISIREYDKVKEICKKTNTRIRITGREGLFFYLYKIKRQISLVGGTLIFAGAIFYLSTFIWSVNITTDKYLSPYEVRQKIYSYGIKPGIAKSKVDVRLIEDRMLKDNNNIMYVRVRMEGSALKVTVAERIPPPVITEDKEACDVVAKADGQVVTIFSTSGTPVVKTGDIVKKGQVLIKGEQGKEGSVYPVHAKGQVIAKTYYEYEREMQLKGLRYEPTGRKAENTYIEVMGRKIYLKKSLNKFASCDKIVDNKGFLKNEVYSETKPVEFILDEDKTVEDTVNELYKKTMESLNDKSAKLVDKIVDREKPGNNIKVRAVFVVEIDIAEEQKVK